jgi:hypothetical protein
MSILLLGKVHLSNLVTLSAKLAKRERPDRRGVVPVAMLLTVFPESFVPQKFGEFMQI